MSATLKTYTFSSDAVTMVLDAADDTEAALKFAAWEGIKGVEGLAGLLGRIAESGGYATVTDGRGGVVGRVNRDTGAITIYPEGR